MARPDRRCDIMAAAERLYAHRRYHEVTLDEVAAECHVGKGTIYRYFSDKEDLFFQTATSGFDEMCELVLRAGEGGRDFHAQLAEACRRINYYFERRKQLIRLMQIEEDRHMWEGGTMRERWRRKRTRLVEAVAAIVRRGVAEGFVRADVPAEILANYLLGILRTRARDLVDADAAGRSFDIALELFLGGVRPDRAGAATGGILHGT